jgi:hypothetical protein
MERDDDHTFRRAGTLIRSFREGRFSEELDDIVSAAEGEGDRESALENIAYVLVDVCAELTTIANMLLTFGAERSALDEDQLLSGICAYTSE